MKLLPESNITVESKGNKGTLIMESASSSYSEVYDCRSDEDELELSDFCEAVKGDMLSFFSWQANFILQLCTPSWPLTQKKANPKHYFTS